MLIIVRNKTLSHRHWQKWDDLDQGDYEGLDQYNVAKPFCKKAYRVDRAQEVGSISN